MPTIKRSTCLGCTHFHTYPLLTCDAFPDGIPEEITAGQFDHTNPHRRDNGIRFESLIREPPIRPFEPEEEGLVYR